jgi:hypothetical protein
MLYSAKVAACTQIHTKHINTRWRHNNTILNIQQPAAPAQLQEVMHQMDR